MLKMNADDSTDDISVYYEGDLETIAFECAAVNAVLVLSLIKNKTNADDIAWMFQYVADHFAMLVDNTLADNGEKNGQ